MLFDLINNKWLSLMEYLVSNMSTIPVGVVTRWRVVMRWRVMNRFHVVTRCHDGLSHFL